MFIYRHVGSFTSGLPHVVAAAGAAGDAEGEQKSGTGSPLSVAATLARRENMQQGVLTLRQVPLEIPQTSSAHLPQPSRREHVQVTQLSIEPDAISGGSVFINFSVLSIMEFCNLIITFEEA